MDIDGIYISHMHADHIGGLEFIAFKRYFSKFPFGTNRPKLYSNLKIMKDLWNKSLRGGLESIQNRKNNIKSYFDIKPIISNGNFSWEGISFDLIQTVHVVDNREIKPSYGLMIHVNGKKIFFTCDTQFSPSSILSFYQSADIIFHDCELAIYPQSVHAQYNDLKSLNDKIKNKMWLYHYDGDISKYEPQKDGFLGFATKGQSFEF